MKKTYIAIIAVFFILSLMINVFLCMTLYRNEVLLRIDGNPVLTKAELVDILFDKYQKTVLNSILGQNLIQMSTQASEIPDMTNEDIEWLESTFPNYLSKNSERESLQEFYSVYSLYDDVCDIDDDISRLFKNFYATVPVLYTVVSLIGQDHELLMKISSDLEAGESIDAINTRYNINLEATDVPSLNVYGVTEDEISGKTLHMDLGNQDMQIIFLLNKYSYSTENKKQFKDFYFKDRYLEIKARIVSLLKDNYNINYE